MPMAFANRRILKLANRSQTRQHIFDGGFELDVSVPGSHLLVEQANVFGELLALDVHVLDVNLSPRCRLPVLDAGLHDEHVVPELLEFDPSESSIKLNRNHLP